MAKKRTTRTRKSKKLEKILENPYLKTTWAEWATSTLTPKYYVCRYDDKKKNRFYYFTNEGEVIIAAGVTTVFGLVSTEREAINKWKEGNVNWRHLLDITAQYGTAEHIIYGEIMRDEGVDKTKIKALEDIAVANGASFNMPSKDVLSFLKFQEDYKLTPLLIEASLLWQDPETGEWLAMTIDLLAKITVTEKTKTQVADGVYQRGVNKGKPRFKSVVKEKRVEKILNIDFKSNFFDKERKTFFETNRMQLMAGNLAVEQNFGIKVDGCYNYAPAAWRTKPNYTFFEHNITDKDWDIFNAYWKLAQVKGINKPQGNMLITEGFKNSDDYKFLTYKEYVEQVLMKDDTPRG